MLKSVADKAVANNNITLAVYRFNDYEQSKDELIEGDNTAVCMFYVTRNMQDPEWRMQVVQQFPDQERDETPGWKPPILTRTKAAFEAVVNSTFENFIYRYDDDGVGAMSIAWVCMQGRTEPPPAVVNGPGAMMPLFKTAVYDMKFTWFHLPKTMEEDKQTLIRPVLAAAEALVATA